MELIVTALVIVLGIVSFIGYVTFYLNSMNQINRIIQGDLNATQEFGESVKDEVISEVIWKVTTAFFTAVVINKSTQLVSILANTLI